MLIPLYPKQNTSQIGPSIKHLAPSPLCPSLVHIQAATSWLNPTYQMDTFNISKIPYQISYTVTSWRKWRKVHGIFIRLFIRLTVPALWEMTSSSILLSLCYPRLLSPLALADLSGSSDCDNEPILSANVRIQRRRAARWHHLFSTRLPKPIAGLLLCDRLY